MHFFRATLCAVVLREFWLAAVNISRKCSRWLCHSIIALVPPICDPRGNRGVVLLMEGRLFKALHDEPSSLG